MQETIWVFIGTEPKTEIARKVLEHSITKNTKADVRFVPMIGPEWEYDTKGFTQGTGFSLRRWMIPAYCKWKGFAIYLDADQVVLGDIEELYNIAAKAKAPKEVAWMTYQPSKFSKDPHPNSSVAIFNCENARKLDFFHIEKLLAYLKKRPDKGTYSNLMFPNWLKPRVLPNSWNALNTYTHGVTKLLHYTKEPEQPWYVPNHPLAYLWKQALKDALRCGKVTPEEVREAVAKFGIKEDWRSTNGLHPEYLQCLS